MDYDTLTVEDCIRKMEQERAAAVIEDGAVTGFVEEKALTGTANTDKGMYPKNKANRACGHYNMTAAHGSKNYGGRKN